MIRHLWGGAGRVNGNKPGFELAPCANSRCFTGNSRASADPLLEEVTSFLELLGRRAMLRLNAFLFVGGLAAFVVGSALGFKVLGTAGDAGISVTSATRAEASPRPAEVATPKAD